MHHGPSPIPIGTPFALDIHRNPDGIHSLVRGLWSGTVGPPPCQFVSGMPPRFLSAQPGHDSGNYDITGPFSVCQMRPGTPGAAGTGGHSRSSIDRRQPHLEVAQAG